MDIPLLVAEWIERKLGVPAEAEPSPADIRDPKFIVSAESFWVEPHATVFDTEHNFVDDGPWVEGFQSALPITVVYAARSTGEHFRSDFLEQARKNAIIFSAQHKIPIIGGKLYGNALDKVRNHIADIDDHNKNDETTGQAYILLLSRDPRNDVVFEPVEKDNLRRGYIARQAFTGHVAFWDGHPRMEV